MAIPPIPRVIQIDGNDFDAISIPNRKGNWLTWFTMLLIFFGPPVTSTVLDVPKNFLDVQKHFWASKEFFGTSKTVDVTLRPNHTLRDVRPCWKKHQPYVRWRTNQGAQAHAPHQTRGTRKSHSLAKKQGKKTAWAISLLVTCIRLTSPYVVGR